MLQLLGEELQTFLSFLHLIFRQFCQNWLISTIVIRKFFNTTFFLIPNFSFLPWYVYQLSNLKRRKRSKPDHWQSKEFAHIEFNIILAKTRDRAMPRLKRTY